MGIRGKPLTPEEKKLIVSIKNYFDCSMLENACKKSSVEKTADAVNIGVATVKRIMAEYKRDPDFQNQTLTLRGRPSYAIEVSYQEQVRQYIREANQNGKHITLENIRHFIQKNSEKEFSIATLGRTLDRWGFEFGEGVRTQHLKEKDYVIAARHRYLRIKKENRIHNDIAGIIRPEVYLDESYVNKNHSNDYTWYSDEDGPWIQKPTGNGERLIILEFRTSEARRLP